MAFYSNLTTNVQVGICMLCDSKDDRIIFVEICGMIPTTSVLTMGLA